LERQSNEEHNSLGGTHDALRFRELLTDALPNAEED
jgi:hypothetical protein